MANKKLKIWQSIEWYHPKSIPMLPEKSLLRQWKKENHLLIKIITSCWDYMKTGELAGAINCDVDLISIGQSIISREVL